MIMVLIERTFLLHQFTLSVTAGGSSVEYLAVAGGGGGGAFGGAGAGGGGAGGLRTNLAGHPLAGAALPVSTGNYTVTVGAGGIRGDGTAYGN